MDYVGALERLNADNALYCCGLLVYYQAGNEACGINFATSFSADLKRVIAEKHREQAARIELAVMLQIVIKTGHNTIQGIVTQVETAENKRELLERALEIQDRVEMAAAMLNELASNGA